MWHKKAWRNERNDNCTIEDFGAAVSVMLKREWKEAGIHQWTVSISLRICFPLWS